MAAGHTPWQQAAVYLRAQGPGEWSLRLFASDTPAGIDAVLRGEADLGIVNPSGPLAVAYKGAGPYQAPQPVRVIATIPSYDQFVFAVKPELGLTCFEDIGQRRVPLRISMRGQPDHSTHWMLEHVAQAAGFSMDELRSWGGQVLYHPGMPSVELRTGSVLRGEANAIIDESVGHMMRAVELTGLQVLPLREETVRKLEAMGYRRAIIEKQDHPSLPADVLSIDFSGWPVFCHADATDQLVTEICRALEARKDRIPWQGEGPLPLERMCKDAPDAPLDVPLHPAAERFWRERGYLTSPGALELSL